MKYKGVASHLFVLATETGDKCKPDGSVCLDAELLLQLSECTSLTSEGCIRHQGMSGY